jgi:hypothetical protein
MFVTTATKCLVFFAGIFTFTSFGDKVFPFFDNVRMKSSLVAWFVTENEQDDPTLQLAIPPTISAGLGRSSVLAAVGSLLIIH